MQSDAKRGALAGAIAGLVFGLALQILAVRTPAGSRVLLYELITEMGRSRSFFVGWAFHLFDCVLMGAIFGAIMGRKATRYGVALKYGASLAFAWWVLGGIFLMPIFLGLSVFSPQTIEPIRPVAFQSLVGHLIYGVLFGATFVALRGRMRKPEYREREHAKAG